jgi:hypothetical protein
MRDLICKIKLNQRSLANKFYFECLGEKRLEIMNLKNRYGNGYECFSVENAIINEKTRRWPLFIDP